MKPRKNKKQQVTILVLEESHQRVSYIHAGLQEQKSQNYITEYRDRLDLAHND